MQDLFIPTELPEALVLRKLTQLEEIQTTLSYLVSKALFSLQNQTTSPYELVQDFASIIDLLDI